MKKAIVMTSVAFVLLLAVIAAGLNVIFTVTHIDAKFSTFTEEGAAEAESLKKELDGFVGDSTTFLNLDSVRETVEKYPCFHMESAKKKFPKTVEVVVRERRELFAYGRAEGGFVMLDAEGNCLRESEENVSRTGGDNILLKQFELNTAIGKRADGVYFDALLSAFSGFDALLTDARSNIGEVVLRLNGSHNNPLTNLFEIKMREGVVIEMINPLSRAREKAVEAIKTYEALGDIAKMNGWITVTESSSGEINAVYFESRG